MLFVTETVKSEDLKNIQNFFDEYDSEVKAIEESQIVEETTVTRYITSLVSSKYQKSVEDIENTKVGNKVIRKRNLQQIMQESFFYGSNRFGNNFIA